ncbi:6-phosphogluconate dehydrogenase, NAD(+)-dependent, decarboxylating [bacterium HR41]|nr:6-phosphogluconate dehydrogenase, NAD(+)-dependent, decarboxylating [bacterium HR41]
MGAPEVKAVGFVGLGRMGRGLAARLGERAPSIAVHGFDPDERARTEAARSGVAVSDTVEALVAALPRPRVVWLMVPAGEATSAALASVAAATDRGDVIVEGGNSDWRDSVRRGRELEARGIDFVDVGVSGGIWGRSEGFCLMAGGSPTAFARLEPVLSALAPDPHPEFGEGYAHVGPVGAGHFVKMVHNGVEYGLMQAYAEGFALLRSAPFGLDLARLARLWMQGSVVRSWLLELAGRALASGQVEELEPWVEDSGEGRWTVEQAIASAVPVPTIAAALFARFASRGGDDFQARLLAALRNQFGGHAVRRGDGGAEGG